MATSTQHFNLIKPSVTDNVSVNDLNTNFENIDTIMYDNQQKSESALNDLADAFSTASTYDVGDLCIYQNQLYKCTAAITTVGAWDSTKWTATTLADELGSGDTGVEYNVTLQAGASDAIPYSDLGITKKGAYLISTTASNNDKDNYGWAGLYVLHYAALATPTSTMSDLLQKLYDNKAPITASYVNRTITVTNNTGNRVADITIKCTRI